MKSSERVYLAIDLKSFYASVECVDRGLDPIRVNLVVADESRTDKTICLAVSPALKSFGIPGRPRLFEVKEKLKQINRGRGKGKQGLSSPFLEDLCDESVLVDFLIAPPRMSRYLEVSAKIGKIYEEYLSFEDIHVYSIDEVFMDVSDYLPAYKMSAEELASTILKDVYARTGITATAGVGSNLYLAKIAMDLLAKHIEPNKDGVRVASLDEMSYRKTLWPHRPLTDFWRVGRATAEKLSKFNVETMGDLARFSLSHEDLLYQKFGVLAELLIDHAWGYEPCTIEEIKKYRPKAKSLGAGQVLSRPYSFEEGKLIVREMAYELSFELVEKGLCADRITLSLGYDSENVRNPNFGGEVKLDFYGRAVPKSARGTISLGGFTSSTKTIVSKCVELFERIANPALSIRRVYVTFVKVCSQREEEPVQLDLFSLKEEKGEEKEKKLQEAVLKIRKKFGKNALLKGMDFQEGATTISRHQTIGGHRK